MLWWVLWWVRVKHPFVYRNSLSWQPGLKLNYYQTRNHWYWQSLIFFFTSRRLIYVIFQDPICLMWYWPTTPHHTTPHHTTPHHTTPLDILRFESHHGPTLAFSRYKELLGHKQIEMSVNTCHCVTTSLSGSVMTLVWSLKHRAHHHLMSPVFPLL